MHTICEVILWALSEIIYGKHFIQHPAHREQLTNISYLYDRYLFISGNTLLVKELNRQIFTHNLGHNYCIILQSICRVSKKNSVVTTEIWENIHTKDLQEHFNYTRGV